MSAPADAAADTIAFKLIARDEWRAAQTVGAYAGSAVDLADGYIHMSTQAQLAETASKHYAGRDDLILLSVDLNALGDAVVWEPSRGGALFPHLYGSLPVTAVVQEQALSVSAGGEMRLDDSATTKKGDAG